ncbi:MAG: hypothetical protein HW415_482 [Deltaproteobacteria bacterium]|nr:hypothetical protein [Deltaproteobacteria bacterium]
MVKKTMFESNAGEGGFQDLWSKLLSMFNTGKEEVVRSSKVSKVRLDLSSLKKDRERVFERLGEEVYKKHKEKGISIPGLAPFFTEIEMIDNNLSSKGRELKELKGEAVSVPSVTETGTEFNKRPRKRYHRPNIISSEARQDVK